MTKDTKKNKRYDKKEKDKLIKRMLLPESISPTNLSIETGISPSTLATWKAKASREIVIKGKRSFSSKEKFMIVMETYTFSEIELSKYCREKGLYVQDVKEWRIICIAANDSSKNTVVDLSDELRDEKKKSKELAREIRLKDKALAETTALLVLRKKLNAIFGENEED